MSTGITTLKPRDFFMQETIKSKFTEILGKNGASFVASVLQIVSSNSDLSNATSESIYQSAMVAATLNLPINNNLGFAYIVPFKNRNGQVLAQFQLGYKGYIQLAQRSGQFKRIAVSEVRDGQIKSNDPLKGYVFDWSVNNSDKIIGYVSYFELLNGYEATLYMSTDELKAHGVRFSQTFKKGFGLWKDDFNSMAKKTVLKLLLSRFAPMSVDMQKAIVTDQSVINDYNTLDVSYIDNPPKEKSEIDLLDETTLMQWGTVINECKTIDELKSVMESNEGSIHPQVMQLITNKKIELQNEKA